MSALSSAATEAEATGELLCIKHDPNLRPWAEHVRARWAKFLTALQVIQEQYGGLEAFTRLQDRGIWVDPTTNNVTYTEYAPNAQAISLVGEFNGLDVTACPMSPVGPLGAGLWRCEVRAISDGTCPIADGSEVVVIITPTSATGDKAPLRRIPAQIYHATQTPGETSYRGRMSRPPRIFPAVGFEGDDSLSSQPQRPSRPPKPAGERIYEAHIGVASDSPASMGTYASFRQNVLPRIVAGGYTTIQLMGIAEHPYYPSFGYQVSNFFAVSSRFGSTQDLIDLIDDIHRQGLRVIVDIVQAHSTTNEGEGLSYFDGSADAGYFKSHLHPEWQTRLFDFSRLETVRFHLSNLRYWTTRIGFDGFRFDAITAMLYHDHGFHRSFTGNYQEYFGPQVDDAAVTYLMLAHHLLEELEPNTFTTVAEDVSGYPSLGIPVAEGGLGFTYRLGLGVPDLWFGLLEGESDFDNQPHGYIARILGSLMMRRADLGEKTIAYVESHDQCIVGGRTAAQWLFAEGIYDCMSKFQTPTPRVEMAMAWHKLMRLLTHTLGGEGYLNFMGNEFGHPEWIDMPSENNHYSSEHAYRKWALVDDTSLRFEQLNAFDRALNQRENQLHWLAGAPASILLHKEAEKQLVYTRSNVLFVFNLSAKDTWDGPIPAPTPGKYENVLDTDEGWYGGSGQCSRTATAVKTAAGSAHPAEIRDCLIPPRTGAIFQRSV